MHKGDLLPCLTATLQLSKLPTERTAGACLHITSLPGPYGIGELGQAAHRFIDTLCAMGMRVWQFLPVGATGDEPSPYQPVSIYAGNTLLIDVAALLDEGLVDAEDAAPLTELPNHETNFERLIPLKHQLLNSAARRFHDRASATQKSALDKFILQNDTQWLHNYALFEALRSMHDGSAWPDWEPQYAHRDASALEIFEKTARQRVLEIKILQFLFFQQWQALRSYAQQRGVLLFGDVPIYVPLDSADVWENPQLLQIDRHGRARNVAGVPPDYFSADGQRWGNPLYDWDYHARTGYQWWIQRVQYAVSLADIIRLDHFRAFESYWSIPASSETAREGKWISGPGDAPFVALRNALGDLPIVAEDLGVITEAVIALRDRQRFPGMKVLQFLLDDEHFDIRQIPRNSVCYTGTHDNDTSVGWFESAPRDTVLRNSHGKAETIHTDLVRLALKAEARLSIIMMQDLLGLGSEARMNNPGSNKGNWRWRLQAGQIDADLCESVREMVVASGRSA